MLVEKYMWYNSPFGFFLAFWRQNQSKHCLQGEFAACIEPFHKVGNPVSFHIQIFQKRIMGALKSDFSGRGWFSRFYSKILVQKCIWYSSLWNLLLEAFGDQTNAKLCWEAEYVILWRAFSEKAMLQVYSTKIAKI